MAVNEIQIEKGIPSPNKPTRGSDLPFDKLEIGDSFLVDRISDSWGWLYAKIQKAQSKLNIQLTSRNENGKRRVWRVA